MTPNKSDSTIVIQSPVEFLITGAAGPHDRVLVRSENCQLDLIGFAQQPRNNEAREQAPGSGVFEAFSRDRNKMQYVESLPLSRGQRSGDDRDSTYKFCWVGYASRSQRERILDVFQRQTADLEDALEGQDSEKISWAMAPIVYQCSIADMRRRSSRKTLAILFAVYALIALVSVAIVMAWQLQRMVAK